MIPINSEDAIEFGKDGGRQSVPGPRRQGFRLFLYLSLLVVLPLHGAAGVISATQWRQDYTLMLLLIGLVIQPISAVGIWFGKRWGYVLVIVAMLLCFRGLAGALGVILLLGLEQHRFMNVMMNGGGSNGTGPYTG